MIAGPRFLSAGLIISFYSFLVLWELPVVWRLGWRLFCFWGWADLVWASGFFRMLYVFFDGYWCWRWIPLLVFYVYLFNIGRISWWCGWVQIDSCADIVGSLEDCVVDIIFKVLLYSYFRIRDEAIVVEALLFCMSLFYQKLYILHFFYSFFVSGRSSLR